jgi:hypothetical protein
VHLTSEQLTLLALGEPVDGADHLDACERCRAELDALTTVVGIGRDTRGLTLTAPPPRVWEAIAASTGVATSAVAPVAPGRPRPDTRRLLILAAAFVLVALAGLAFLLRGTESTVTGRAELSAYGSTPPSARGEAEVVASSDGTSALRLHVKDLPAAPGYFEVWLIDPVSMRMFSIGVLNGQSDVELPLPAGVDLHTYSLVDVSAETYDGNVAHSGNSLLRGTLSL